MSKDEALKLALEAFEDRISLMKWQKAREAIKEALEQPEQEPVAWMRSDGMKAMPALEKEALLSTGLDFCREIAEEYSVPLYTTPPKREWVGLTGLEQKELMAMSAREAVFATEAKLKEKQA